MLGEILLSWNEASPSITRGWARNDAFSSSWTSCEICCDYFLISFINVLSASVNVQQSCSWSINIFNQLSTLMVNVKWDELLVWTPVPPCWQLTSWTNALAFSLKSLQSHTPLSTQPFGGPSDVLKVPRIIKKYPQCSVIPGAKLLRFSLLIGCAFFVPIKFFLNQTCLLKINVHCGHVCIIG